MEDTDYDEDENDEIFETVKDDGSSNCGSIIFDKVDKTKPHFCATSPHFCHDANCAGIYEHEEGFEASGSGLAQSY